MSTLIEKTKNFVDSEVKNWIADHNTISSYPEKLIMSMANLGIFGMNIPKIYGGLDLKSKEIFYVVRELAQGFIPLTGALGSHLKVSRYIVKFGTPTQKQLLLPDMASGKIIAAHAFTESEGKSVDTMQTKLTKENNKLILKGRKTLVTNAANANLIAIVSANCLSRKEANKKVAIILLPRNQKGLSVGIDIPRLGMEGISLCELVFECQVLDEQVLGGCNLDGRDAIQESQTETLINYSSRAVGLAETIVEETINFTNTKKSYDKLLRDIPAVQDKIALMKDGFKKDKSMLDDIISKLEVGEDVAKYAYKVKALITESTVDIARIGLALHGGAGYTKKFHIERHFREAMGLTLIGTPTDIALEKAK